jgi:hypothetical protein
MRNENEALKQRQQHLEKELMQQDLYFKSISTQTDNPMCVGMPQLFELIDTQKTDHALEKYTVKVVNKTFARVVESRVNLEV